MQREVKSEIPVLIESITVAPWIDHSICHDLLRTMKRQSSATLVIVGALSQAQIQTMVLATMAECGWKRQAALCSTI